nr:uncharacterized protein LOC121502822 [Drosophila kikkawai]
MFVSIKEQLGPDVHNTSGNDTTLSVFNTSSIKLPRLALPTFDGKYSEYQNFFTSFKQVVDAHALLSPIEKFNQLLNCLRGSALETVKAFQVTPENYANALERLRSRYDNPTLVFLDNISSLFNLPKVAKSNSQTLRSLIDNATSLFNSLLSLGSETQIVQAMFISIVMNEVDQETKRKWNESLDYGTLPSWPKCVEVVERHCQYLEALSNANGDPNATQQIATKQRPPQQHPGNTSVDHRFQIIKKLGLCINCFGKGHHVAKCPSTQKCRICSQSHHTMLHREVVRATPSPPLPSQPQSNAPQISNAVIHTHRETQVNRVILATALVLVKDASGCYKIGRALLDSCSQVNFMSDEFAQALRIPRIKRHMEIRSIGESQTQIKHRASTTIKSRFNALELMLSVNRNVERLWKVEDVSKSADIYTPEQRKCEEKFVDSVRRDDDGHIGVRLPFKTDPSLLGNSYETARRRFQALERRLSRSADIRSKYIDFMQEFQTLGHMSLVEMPQLNVPHFYISHHCVLKPTSTSTKLRVVFDASCQTTSQKSISDLLMVGPTIQPDLYTLLLRFRTYRYVITADVVKMFRQVLVDADDRKFQYILWRSNPVEPVRTFELNTVTYGTATAPYLAIRNMIYLADQYSNKFKVGADAIKTSFYVDDFLCGADTVDGLARIKAEVSEILSSGEFEIAKWHSNYTKFVDDRTIKDLNLEEDSTLVSYFGPYNQRAVTLKQVMGPVRVNYGTMSHGMMNIEKLSGDNYESWSLQMKSLLVTSEM